MSLNLPDLPSADPVALPPVAGSVGIRQSRKAAILVRLLLGKGVKLSLTDLPDSMQTALAEEIGALHLVQRETIDAILSEFMAELDSIGMANSGGLEAALGVLNNAISPATSQRMRREIGLKVVSDPWERLEGLEVERLAPIIEGESHEVGAVILSKLKTARSAELLAALPGEKARRIAYAMSLTGAVTPDAVERIGASLASQLDAQPEVAFEDDPVERIGAILNNSPSQTREDVLGGLDETDVEFAGRVRQAIFTFANIPDRVAASDIPKVIRGIEQDTLVTALASAPGIGAERAAKHVLENMSKRMADQISEAIEERGAIKPAEGETAMSVVVAEIRRLADAGEIYLITEDAEAQ